MIKIKILKGVLFYSSAILGGLTSGYLGEHYGIAMSLWMWFLLAITFIAGLLNGVKIES